MKTNKNFLITLVLMTVCSIGQAFGQDQAAIEAKIKELDKMFSQQMISGNFNTDYYADDAISMPNNQPMLEGIAALRANTEQMKASGVKFQNFATTPTKFIFNGNMVIEIGTYALSINVPNMPSPVSDNGKYLTIWEIQKDGSLKIKIETWNTDQMPQQP